MGGRAYEYMTVHNLLVEAAPRKAPWLLAMPAPG
jgi:hypothetical protein